LTASIGLFVAVLGFRNAGLVLANAKTNALMLGDFLSPARWWRCAACSWRLRCRRGASWAPFYGRFCLPPWWGFRRGHPSAGQLFAMPHSLAPVFGHVDMLGALNIAFLPFLFVFFASEFSPPWGPRWRWAAKRDCWMKKATCRRSTARLWSIRLRRPRPVAGDPGGDRAD
jgi:AGZA family xanthine/uracil permease-like MFS transporter